MSSLLESLDLPSFDLDRPSHTMQEQERTEPEADENSFRQVAKYNKEESH